jgi:hypothetical protein
MHRVIPWRDTPLAYDPFRPVVREVRRVWITVSTHHGVLFRITTSDQDGWHDIAGCITHHGVHHVYQGQGWNHGYSTDMVQWKVGPHGPSAIEETYAGMHSYSDPCSGFLTKDPNDNGRVCAGFRQCGSDKGVAGGNDWDVPMELRCAGDAELTQWSEEPEYIFNVSWCVESAVSHLHVTTPHHLQHTPTRTHRRRSAPTPCSLPRWRAIPYDPARPWREADGT